MIISKTLWEIIHGIKHIFWGFNPLILLPSPLIINNLQPWGLAIDCLHLIHSRIGYVFDLASQLQTLSATVMYISQCFVYKYIHDNCSDELFAMIPRIYKFKHSNILPARSHDSQLNWLSRTVSSILRVSFHADRTFFWLNAFMPNLIFKNLNAI